MSKRMFVALELPEACQARLAGLATPIRGATWLEAGQFHLTLAFAGETSAEMESRLRERLAELRVPPFSLPVKGVGSFGKSSPAVIWAGVGNGHPHLFALHKRVHDALFAAGMNPQLRAFHPHVTLARLKDVAAPTIAPFLKKHETTDFCRLEITSFGLYSSRPGPQESSYTLEASFPLQARRQSNIE